MSETPPQPARGPSSPLPPRARFVVGLGSNLKPEIHLEAALARLAGRCKLVSVSTVYRCPAVGRPHQPDFLNAAALGETDLSPGELKAEVFAAIESALGRRREADRFAPRTIDLDLLLYRPLHGQGPPPHPDLGRFAHVAVPAAEVAPDWSAGGLAPSLTALARRFDPSALEVWAPPRTGEAIPVAHA